MNLEYIFQEDVFIARFEALPTLTVFIAFSLQSLSRFQFFKVIFYTMAFLFSNKGSRQFTGL